VQQGYDVSGTIPPCVALRECCGKVRTHRQPCRCDGTATGGGSTMNNIIYIVGLVVVVLAILSFLGLR